MNETLQVLIIDGFTVGILIGIAHEINASAVIKILFSLAVFFISVAVIVLAWII
ncbi:MAG TPA: hypothetical protein PK864_10645 [Syntrophorhabdaceae bacterium]|nr:hypothetical protein [Syntrophorhabdaceae bacterium]HON86463.1 hypothetical protein [Syntrophorhabdaceae bacterium]HOT43220.1 hypothetical protein [Syntrophorhabdaceae bacterium]HPC67672.1 hypothetical protein [Syntrophorhabdaceae bacterium]HQE81065.1 hypothetical protein [Syntrophorhabdaceae bacterium]